MTWVLTPVFVEFIPEILEDGKLYISLTYSTAVHNCCCGCGYKVVTPLSPTGWRITVEGKFVSLYPSIGNWGYPCQSHYWIRRNAVRWSSQMTPQEIEAGRRYHAKVRQGYYQSGKPSAEPEATAGLARADDEVATLSIWQRLMKCLFG
jgi:hypothetical protein